MLSTKNIQGSENGGHTAKGANNFFQSKLAINVPNDVYEQEADAMADSVMQMTNNGVRHQSFFRPAISTIQRKCTQCEDEENKVQRKGNGIEAIPTASNENYISSLSGGRALSRKERSFFEPRMGYDFSDMRLHTDSAADKSAKNLDAFAYTKGNNIVFAANQYQPGTENGKRLMAHELTHTIQQKNNNALQGKFIQRSDDPSTWCSAFMNLVRYEDDNGKWGVITHYHSLSNENLIPLNHNIPSIYGDVDVDWMFRLAFIQYPFIVTSILSPSMSEGFGSIASRIGQIGLKGFWNTIRAPFPEWDLEYQSVVEEGNWNSSIAIVAWIHQDKSLRDIFAPAISMC